MLRTRITFIAALAALAAPALADKGTIIYRLKHNNVKDLHIAVGSTFNKPGAGVRVDKKVNNNWIAVDFGNEDQLNGNWGGGNIDGVNAKLGDAGDPLKITMVRDGRGKWNGRLWETFTGDIDVPKNKFGQLVKPTTRFQKIRGGWKQLPSPNDFTLELFSDTGYEDGLAMLTIDGVYTGMDGALWDTSAWDDVNAHAGAALVDPASLSFSYGDAFESEEDYALLASTVFGQEGEYALVVGQMLMGGEMVDFAYATDVAVTPTPGAAALLGLGALALTRRRR